MRSGEKIILQNQELRFLLKINLKIIKIARENINKNIFEVITEDFIITNFSENKINHIANNVNNADVDGEILDCLLEYEDKLCSKISSLRSIIFKYYQKIKLKRSLSSILGNSNPLYISQAYYKTSDITLNN